MKITEKSGDYGKRQNPIVSSIARGVGTFDVLAPIRNDLLRSWKRERTDCERSRPADPLVGFWSPGTPGTYSEPVEIDTASKLYPTDWPAALPRD